MIAGGISTISFATNNPLIRPGQENQSNQNLDFRNSPASARFKCATAIGAPQIWLLDRGIERSGNLAERANGRTPSLAITGISRGFTRRVSTSAMPMCLSRAKGNRMQLILGPRTRGDCWSSYVGEVEFGAAAPVDGNIVKDFFALRRRWFDR
jgi:hypothetical protein